MEDLLITLVIVAIATLLALKDSHDTHIQPKP